MFSGDLLFAGSIGRTDLPGGDPATMMDSLARVCLTLPDETAVLPGHGPQTTIGAERAGNQFLAGLRPGAGPGAQAARPGRAHRALNPGLYRGDMIRTHEAGTLRAEQAGQTVTLAGWVARRRDHGGVTFIDLRDASGVVQVVFRAEADDAPAHALRAEFCVLVTGQVRRRPAGNENPELPTGEIEVAADELEVLAESDPLPFPIDETGELNEEVRLRYRYLDMRRAETAAALRARSEATYLRQRRAARAPLRVRGDART